MYTKGEWHVSPHAWPKDHQVFVVDNSHNLIAEAKGDTQEEAEANAHLIAAAPMLYEALKELMDVLRHSKSQLRGRVLSTQALAKAEGKE